MMTTLDRIQAIADLTLALGEVNRATQHPDGRAETDTTHTIMLSLIAADLAPDDGVEIADAVLFALVHDLAEAYAGDTNTARALNPEQAQAKAEREAAALTRIRQDLAASPWIAAAIDAYERKRIRRAASCATSTRSCPNSPIAATGAPPSRLSG